MLAPYTNLGEKRRKNDEKEEKKKGNGEEKEKSSPKLSSVFRIVNFEFEAVNGGKMAGSSRHSQPQTKRKRSSPRRDINRGCTNNHNISRAGIKSMH